MITVGDIAKWFGDTWTADATLLSLVPNVWFLRVYERSGTDTNAPYVNFQVVNTMPGETTGPLVFPQYRIDCKVYVDQNTASNPDTINRQIFYTFAPMRIPKTLRNGSIIEITKGLCDEKFDPQLRNSNDVLVSSFSWNLECEGTMASL